MKTTDVASDHSPADHGVAVWLGGCYGISEVPESQVRDYYAGQLLVVLISLVSAAIFFVTNAWMGLA